MQQHSNKNHWCCFALSLSSVLSVSLLLTSVCTFPPLIASIHTSPSSSSSSAVTTPKRRHGSIPAWRRKQSHQRNAGKMVSLGSHFHLLEDFIYVHPSQSLVWEFVRVFFLFPAVLPPVVCCKITA